jgi:DNA-binding CsgD family transcriptional regulator
MLVRPKIGNAPDGSYIIPENIHLSRREISALVLVADGIDNKTAGKMLRISENTFRNHISNVMRKLSATSRTHALVLAIQNGIIEVTEKRTLQRMEGSMDSQRLCVFCERVFDANDIIEVEGEQITINHVKVKLQTEYLCPYEDCGGWALISIPWEYAKQEYPDYPTIPKGDEIYHIDIDKYLRDRFGCDLEKEWEPDDIF